MRTAVIVLGDLGRSPRMQYHAVSLAAAGSEVDLIGLDGAQVIPAIASNPRVHVHRLPDRAFARRATGGVRRFVFASAARALGQAARLFTILMRIPKPDVILVQNPPAVPTLSIAWLAARLRGARFVIDWHNLSHTIAAVKVGDHHRAVKALARSEKRWATRADAHLTVSKSFAEWLTRHYGITAVVAYDRPSASFVKPAPAAADALWQQLSATGQLPPQRVPLAICPTSWTPDEDFDLLLEALERAERVLRQHGAAAPALAVILTGRGPLRDSFETRLARRNLSIIFVKTVWLEPEDYPTLVGMADLGLCLHQSSSGLDLPMKLADLGGAGIPVAVYDYSPVLSEVIASGQHGVLFRDPGDLANLFVGVATGALAPDGVLARSREWLAQHPPERWDDQWNATARHALLRG